ncbi:MAG: YjfB family protein [Lachnospiraceae bacterium]|nr:YjfB family protein [Lachnospiraceae bacterium]
MDIAALSMSMSMSNLQTQIGIALMDKAMETAEITTDGLQQMMEASVTPHLGQMIDISL